MDIKDGKDYAWNWFVYHAGQRIVAFQIFLIFFGALAVGLSYSLEHHNFSLIRAISLAAAFISFAFLILEYRNEKLVQIGRNALKKVEASEGFKNLPQEFKLLHIDEKRPRLSSHKFWFRSIYVVCIAVFLWLAWCPSTLSSDNGSESRAAPSARP